MMQEGGEGGPTSGGGCFPSAFIAPISTMMVNNLSFVIMIRQAGSTSERVPPRMCDNLWLLCRGH